MPIFGQSVKLMRKNKLIFELKTGVETCAKNGNNLLQYKIVKI